MIFECALLITAEAAPFMVVIDGQHNDIRCTLRRHLVCFLRALGRGQKGRSQVVRGDAGAVLVGSVQFHAEVVDSGVTSDVSFDITPPIIIVAGYGALDGAGGGLSPHGKVTYFIKCVPKS